LATDTTGAASVEGNGFRTEDEMISFGPPDGGHGFVLESAE
jgi:hypothetical protein